MKRFFKYINYLFVGTVSNLSLSFFLYSVISFLLAYIINTFIEYNFFSIPKPIFNLNADIKRRNNDINLSYIEHLFKFSDNKKSKKLIVHSNIKLTGILWVGNEKFALIEIGKGNKKFLKEGDVINNSKVIKIGSFCIEIEDKEGTKRICIDLKGKSVRRSYSNNNENSYKIREINLEKIDLNKDIFKILKDIVLKPYRENGKRGLIIESVMDTTLVEALGLQEGDVIISINGTPIINKAIFVNKLISSINNRNPIELVIIRNGKEERIKYSGSIFR